MLTIAEKFALAQAMPQRIAYQPLRARAEAARWRRWNMAHARIREAGCDNAGHAHNAMIDRERRPRPGVNYAKLESGLRLMEGQFRAQRYLSKLYDKLGPFAFDFEAGQ